jgi:hypothetical protein
LNPFSKVPDSAEVVPEAISLPEGPALSKKREGRDKWQVEDLA